jgi:hypothetical protein
MDKLKQYLQKHEEDMGTDVPDHVLWQSIESGIALRRKKSGIVRLVIRTMAAACLIGLLVVSTWLLIKENSHPVKPAGVVKNELPTKKQSLPDGDTSVNEHNLAGVSIQPSLNQKKIKTGVKEHRQGIETKPGLTSEIKTVSESYNSLIDHQLSKLRATAVYAEGPGYFTVFTQHLQQAKEDENIIMSDIRQFGLTDELLEELINLYQRKLNTLKTLQAEINKMNNKVKQDASENLKPYYLNI